MKHSELRHQPRHVNPRIQVQRGGEWLQVVISIHAPTRGATAILHKKFVYFYTIPTINI